MLQKENWSKSCDSALIFTFTLLSQTLVTKVDLSKDNNINMNSETVEYLAVLLQFIYRKPYSHKAYFP